LFENVTLVESSAGGDGEGLLFKKGEIIKKVPMGSLVDELIELIDELPQ